MIELTHQNHFQFGRLPDDESTFIAQCGPVSSTPQTPFAEAGRAAALIYEKANGLKLKLCMSGGIDSACMLEAFIAQGIPVEAVFLRFKGGLNEFDLLPNVEFCKQKNIMFSFVDLDIIEFLNSGDSFNIAKKYQCQSPQIATHLWLLEQIDGLPILGGNPIMPIWHEEKWFFIGLPGELHSAYFKYFYLNDRPGIPWFFLYTPELISSFLYTDIAKDFLHKKMTILPDYSYEKKCLGYQQGGFASLPRENKFTGFELVRKHFDEQHNLRNCQHCTPYYNGESFDLRFRRPLEKLFPFPEKLLQLVPANYFPKEHFSLQC